MTAIVTLSVIVKVESEIVQNDHGEEKNQEHEPLCAPRSALLSSCSPPAPLPTVTR